MAFPAHENMTHLKQKGPGQSIGCSSPDGSYQAAVSGIMTTLTPNKGVQEHPNLIQLCLSNCRIYKSGKG